MTAEERNTALLNLLAKVQARHHRANRRWREARFPDCDLDLERDAARARLEYLTDFLSHRFNNPAGRNPDTITLIAQGGLIVSDPDDRQHWVEFHLGRSSCGRMWEIELAVSESARWVVYRGQIPDQETFTTIMRNVESSPSNFGAEIGQVAASRYGTSHPLRNGDL